MEYEQIKQLMEDMGNSKLTSLDIEFPDGIKIKMEKKTEELKINCNKEVNLQEQKNEAMIQDNSKLEIDNVNKIDKCNIVTSPMVGTFYMKSSPNSEPFVELGSTIKKGDILCIIESMKLMNEIESEYDGKIVEILVKDGEPVEYGKPLFKII